MQVPQGKKFFRFITSKIRYNAEEISVVEGFLRNFAELIFVIQENELIFVELIFVNNGSESQK